MDTTGEEFPYPQQLTRDSFVDSIARFKEGGKEFKVDEFLIQNYRYAALDDLHQDLSKLQKTLDKELVEVVNDDYDVLLNQASSIEGSVDLIHYLKLNVSSYQNRLETSRENLFSSREKVLQMLNAKRELQELKRKGKIMQLQDQQVHQLSDLIEQSTKVDIPAVKEMTTVYLSIQRLSQSGNKLGLDGFELWEDLEKQFNALHFKYKGVLDSYVSSKQWRENWNDVLEIMKIYSILGDQKSFLKLVR